ncbi:STAS domain-containing protein [Candidatus Sumerlaeota bacterium]|nr:STAS domain-containing protein [Candidatus Sumerlaeota bacterium]
MEVSVREHDNNLLLALDGEISSSFSNMLREEVKKHLTKETKNVCLDMRKVTMIDSAGLSVLFGIKMMCACDGAKLHLLAPSGIALDTLEKVSFDKVFEFVPEPKAGRLIRDLFGSD